MDTKYPFEVSIWLQSIQRGRHGMRLCPNEKPGCKIIFWKKINALPLFYRIYLFKVGASIRYGIHFAVIIPKMKGNPESRFHRETLSL